MPCPRYPGFTFHLWGNLHLYNLRGRGGGQWLAWEAGRVLKELRNSPGPSACETFSRPFHSHRFYKAQNSCLKEPNVPKLSEAQAWPSFGKTSLLTQMAFPRGMSAGLHREVVSWSRVSRRDEAGSAARRGWGPWLAQS